MISGRKADNLYNRFVSPFILYACASLVAAGGYCISKTPVDPELQWVEKTPLRQVLAKKTEKKENTTAVGLVHTSWKGLKSK